MKEIKVRVWDKANKEMIYPDGNEHHKFKFEVCAYTGNLYYYDFEKKLPGDNYEILLCIGLKDKNDNETYEKDVILYGDIIDYVKFGEGSIYLANSGYLIGELKGYEVIGNILDNPELLESDQS